MDEDWDYDFYPQGYESPNWFPFMVLMIYSVLIVTLAWLVPYIPPPPAPAGPYSVIWVYNPGAPSAMIIYLGHGTNKVTSVAIISTWR